MGNQMEALGFLKDWSIWLVSLQTAVIGLLTVAGKDRMSRRGAMGVVACFVVSIIAATFVLGGIPSIAQRVPKGSEANVYLLPVFEGWPILWVFTLAEHVFFMVGLVIFAVDLMVSEKQAG